MHYIVKKKLFVKKIAIFVQQIFLDEHEYFCHADLADLADNLYI